MTKLTGFGIGSIVAISMALVACSSDSTGTQGPATPAPTATSTTGTGTGGTTEPVPTSTGTTTGAVTSLTVKVMVPADFVGEPVKILFGYGDKQILTDTGALKNVPDQFLPNISGIANPKLVPGQPYELDLSDISIPAGDHFVLVAVYVKGTAGTIPQKDKDYVAGSLVAIKFEGAKATMPEMTLQKSQGVGM